jgi:hypothetical protein
MRTFHGLLWLPVLGLAQLGCTGDVFIATMSDGGGGGVPPVDGAPGAGDSGGGQDASPDAPSGGPCTTSADCAPNQKCGFAETSTCSATGQCFTVPQVECLVYSLGCACDGSEIDVACTGLPSGYSTQPLLHTGECLDASAETDAHAPVPCTSNSDCGSQNGSQEVCGFAMSDACMAQGQCFASQGAICNAFSPGCACDGSEINVACNGLPSGYETKPLRHTGMCTTDGG